MDITARLHLSQGDKNELVRIFDCKENELADKLKPYAVAALEEYIGMFLGQKAFSRGSDIREWRLYLLIKHAFSSRIPDEQEVCELFQTTRSESRSLLRSVMSKCQYLLKDSIEKTLKNLLDRAEVANGDEEITVAIHNRNLVDELNRELAEIDSRLPPVEKKRGSVSVYRIRRSSYLGLCTRFRTEPKVKVVDHERSSVRG